MEDVTFTSKQEATKYIAGLYQNYYKKEVGKIHFSERSFAGNINVSHSVLSNLRGGHKKILESEIAVKILNGIKMEKLIEPVLKILSPEIYKISYNHTRLDSKKNIATDKNDWGDFFNLYTSKAYGCLLSVVFSDLESGTTVDDIKNISIYAEEFLEELVEMDVLNVSDGIVRPSKRIRNLLMKIGNTLQLDLSQSIEQTRLFLDFIVPHRIENDKEFGYNTTMTNSFHSEDLSEVIFILQKAPKELGDLAKKKARRVNLGWEFRS